MNNKIFQEIDEIIRSNSEGLSQNDIKEINIKIAPLINKLESNIKKHTDELKKLKQLLYDTDFILENISCIDTVGTVYDKIISVLNNEAFNDDFESKNMKEFRNNIEKKIDTKTSLINNLISPLGFGRISKIHEFIPGWNIK